jgi:ferric iron reductase protein FhuF
VWSAVELARACGLPWLPIDVGPPSAPADGQGTWRRLRELTEPAALAAQLALIRSECDGHRDVATAFLAARFAWPLARLAVIPVMKTRSVLLFTPPDLWVRSDDRGLFNGVRVDVLSLGPEAGDEAGVPQPATSAHARAAALAVEGYQPVVDGLRRVGSLGARALWGQLADALVATVGSVLDASADPTAAFEHAELLLRAADPPLWVRPDFARAARRDASGLAWRRGSCCLAYRLAWFDLCAGCPLQSRSAWLEALAVHGAVE